MTTITERIADLGYAWRRKDGVPQRRVIEKVQLDWTDGMNKPRALADKIREFADEHDDAQVDIDHHYESHPDYSCDVALELTGWKTVTETDVKMAQESLKRRARTEALARERQLMAELERVRTGKR